MIERLTLWGLVPGRPRPETALPGSPQRCLDRMAVEDATGKTWLLEQLRPGQFDRRERIGRTLAHLSRSGLPVAPYKQGLDGRYVVGHDNAFYQLSPFIPGTPLPQPEYIEDADRGRNLGLYLSALRQSVEDIHEFDNEPRFIMEDYINEIMVVTAREKPDEHDALVPVLSTLAPLFEAWHELPHTLCHGDFHPLNIIWDNRDVAAVIDWEFAGIRPALYDAANCLGCVGIEDPLALVRGLAPALLTTLNKTGCLDTIGLSLLPELVLGLRFAWISEWLRRNDRQMIELEINFIRLLDNSLDTLFPAWEKMLEEQ